MASKRVYEDVAKAIRETKQDMYQLLEPLMFTHDQSKLSEKAVNQVMHTLEQNLIQHFKADNQRFSPKLFKEACHVKL